MKAIDIFCTSQASTAVDHPTPPSSSSSSAAGPAIDRHNPIISDTRRTTVRSFPNPPCSSQYSPINPQPYHQLHKTKSAAADLAAGQIDGKNSAAQNGAVKRKSVKKSSSIIRTDIVRWSCTKPSDLATPPGSTRYLLSNNSFCDGSLDRVSTTIPPIEGNKKVTPNIENREEPKLTTMEISSPPPSEGRTSPPSDQVVVLRVSLHCRGCEGKVRKHLSRMEGVTSFNIDYAAKKVTIMGNITPQSVLERVSKVKNAQFWPSFSDPPPPFIFPSKP